MQSGAIMYEVWLDGERLASTGFLFGARFYIWSHRRRTTKVAALNRKYAKEGS